MINLLPPEVKQNITYARRNTSLRSWLFALLAATVCLCAVIGFGQLYLQHSIDNYAAQLATGQQQLKEQHLEETQQEIETVSGNLKLVVQVLSRAILFSKLLSQVGSTIPSGSVLTNLSISNKVQGGIDLSFSSTDYQTGTQVQLNLADPDNKIFEKADLINIQCEKAPATPTKYPCTIQIRALFAKNNSFTFINNSSGAAQ